MTFWVKENFGGDRHGENGVDTKLCTSLRKHTPGTFSIRLNTLLLVHWKPFDFSLHAAFWNPPKMLLWFLIPERNPLDVLFMLFVIT